MKSGPNNTPFARLNGQGTCETCGKKRYLTRKEARAARRMLYPGEDKMTAYNCGDYWHYGRKKS